jgi:hypothetical protein
MSEQLYLLRISAMNTCDECDIVPSAEIIVDRDLSSEHLPCLDALQALVRQVAETMRSVPFKDVRPMTREEIREWRDEQDAE